MKFLLALIFTFFSIACLILPWINRGRIARLGQEIEKLKSDIAGMQAAPGHNAQRATMPSPIISMPVAVTPPPEKEEHLNLQPPIAAVAQSMHTPAPDMPAEQSQRSSFEHQFGARLPVWIGGIALALAGFFMVKYSIEIGLLSPSVRIVLGLLFGGGLLGAATLIRSKPQFANGTRIAQALSGAGIADLYVCLFAATNLYHLIPSTVGFMGMGLVTAGAVALSLRHGMPIALLGLIGGFLTPALIGSHNPQVAPLFIYLYLILAGLMAVIRKEGWWLMAIPTILFAFGWVVVWLVSSHFAAGDAIWLGLFLLAVSSTVVATSKKHYEAEATSGFNRTSILNYLALGGSIVLMGIVSMSAGFGAMEWGLFGLLAVGCIVLAAMNQKLYGLAPWIAMGMSAVMLRVWDTADIHMQMLVLSLFGALYAVSGYVMQHRSPKPCFWAGLSLAATLGYYLLGYFLAEHYTQLTSKDIVPVHFWGLLAASFAVLGAGSVWNIRRLLPTTNADRQPLMAIYAAGTTAFLSLALTIEVPRDFLPVAFAFEVLGIAAIAFKLDVKALRPIGAVLTGIFAFLLVPQILLLLQLTAFSLTELHLDLQKTVPIVEWPLFQLGLPALAFAAASYLFRRKQDDQLVKTLEIGAVALTGVMGYYLTRHAFHVDENVLFVKAGFMERGVITNILMAYGLLCLFGGRRTLRNALMLSGSVLVGIGMFRIGYFDLLRYNPLWAEQAVGSLPIINALLLTYGLPLLWIGAAAKEWSRVGKLDWSRKGYGFMLLLAFALISLEVRQAYHGEFLNTNGMGNAEIYTYSAAWLLFGIALLFLGTVRKDQVIRIASLAIMILTAGKVFLYDASELEGLFRVVSFFGLGLSLLGLSWFYTRYVFTKVEDKTGKLH